MRTRNSKIDTFVKRAMFWKDEIQTLRSILLENRLDEDLKWGKPCYMYKGRNVAIIQPFKKHCALMFFKGVTFQDKHGLLRKQGENTQSAMRLEFTSKNEIKKAIVSYYLKQAIKAESGELTGDHRKKHELIIPDELSQLLNKNSAVKKAFYDLTPGKQRGYVIHFTGAKQSRTRFARIERCIPKILAGKGFND